MSDRRVGPAYLFHVVCQAHVFVDDLLLLWRELFAWGKQSVGIRGVAHFVCSVELRVCE